MTAPRPTRASSPSGRASPLLAVGATVVLAVTACGSPERPAAPRTSAAAGQSASPALSGQVTVFAAASLTGAFGQIGKNFRAANPNVTVTVNFAASSALAQQIISGAPADVFAAASPATMKTVTDAGDATAPRTFVRNRLQIAVPPDNPGRVTGLPDFAKKDLTIALCAPEVPCGAAAAKVFMSTGITAAPDTLEQDVKAALSKVQLGEVDAALVYRTDILAAGIKVRGIAFPEADKALNDYSIATLASAHNPAGAQALVAYVLSSEGQKVLADAGFDRP